MGIEQGQQNLMVVESLKVANEAGKQQRQRALGGTDGSSSLVEDLERLMGEIREQQMEQDEINQAFADHAHGGTSQSGLDQSLGDQDLLRELEQLE